MRPPGPLCRQYAQVRTQRTPLIETSNNPEPTVPHTPEQGLCSRRMTEHEHPSGWAGTAASGLPPGFHRHGASPAPFCLPSLSPSLLSADVRRCHCSAGSTGMLPWWGPPKTQKGVSIYLIFFSIFTASCEERASKAGFLKWSPQIKIAWAASGCATEKGTEAGVRLCTTCPGCPLSSGNSGTCQALANICSAHMLVQCHGRGQGKQSAGLHTSACPADP